MARVWRAWDPSLQCHVALKEPLFDPRYSGEVHKEVERRFEREAKVGARLRGHPGIVSVYSADVYDGRPVVAMELVDGATLGEILGNGPLDVATTLDVLDQLLDAVGYAHSLGVVHRDLKPDNIFVDKAGRVKVADFGVAGVEDPSYGQATVVSVVLGTPGYMSPEQARGEPADARSDFFSVGVIAYEMLSGRNPFGAGEGADTTELLYRIVHEQPAALQAPAGLAVPAGLAAAIGAAMSKDPAQRPRDAAEFKAWLHGSPVAPGPRAADATTVRPVSGPARKAGGAVAGGTLVMPAVGAFSMPSPSSAYKRWVPVLVVAALCVALLIGLILATPSSGGGAADDRAATDPAGSTAVGSAAASTASQAASSSSAQEARQGEGASSSSTATAGASGASGEAGGVAGASPGEVPEGQAQGEPAGSVATAAPVEATTSAEVVAASAAATAEPDQIAQDYGGAAYDDYAPAGEFWGVWIDAFYDMGTAYACSADANALGLPATVYEVPDEDGTYYVVSVGEYPTRAQAEAAAAQARSLGYANAYTSTAAYL